MGIRFEHSDMLNASLASSLWQAIMDKVVFVMGSKDLKTKIIIFLNMRNQCLILVFHTVESVKLKVLFISIALYHM